LLPVLNSLQGEGCGFRIAHLAVEQNKLNTNKTKAIPNELICPSFQSTRPMPHLQLGKVVAVNPA